jgi:hypothetical protein
MLRLAEALSARRIPGVQRSLCLLQCALLSSLGDADAWHRCER